MAEEKVKKPAVEKKKWVEVELANAHDFEKEKVLTGVLTSTERDVGPNASMLFTFEKDSGDQVVVWGSAVLDGRLRSVPLGSEVKIEYLGTVKNEKTGRTYKNYKVSVREA